MRTHLVREACVCGWPREIELVERGQWLDGRGLYDSRCLVCGFSAWLLIPRRDFEAMATRCEASA